MAWFLRKYQFGIKREYLKCKYITRRERKLPVLLKARSETGMMSLLPYSISAAVSSKISKIQEDKE
jgi:hypothetical protein